MSAVQELCQFYQLNAKGLSKNELRILEIELFSCLCNELNKLLPTHHQRINNPDSIHAAKKEITMTNENIVRNLINDLIQSGEYSLPGIACYTDTPEDVLYDIASGLNTRPSLMLAQRVIELHRVARKEIYIKILDKVIEKTRIVTNDAALD